MRWSQTLIPTLKEIPDGAEIPSHILMLRAGLISQVMAGAYCYLPLGLRSLQKAEKIVRDEMDKAGAVELLMPAITPLSLWERTHRVEAFGNVLMKFDLKRAGKNVSVALGPTHEETFTDLVSRVINSYRQLPIILYQVQGKFRNEERPKFGVLRTSEFLMKDAYSFNTSLESLNESYDKMYAAYCRIFSRCGLDYLPVEAETGPIGGDASHEFMIPSPNGEDTVVCCPKCNYAANTEKAQIGAIEYVKSDEPLAEIQKVATPGAGSIEAICKFLNCKPEQMIKTLVYNVDGKATIVLFRGDHSGNENKIRRFLKAESVELADEAMVVETTGAPVGFAGPVGLKAGTPIYADTAVEFIVNGITGASCSEEAHLTGVNPGRDFTPIAYADLRNAEAGDRCPKCDGILTVRNAIEVGHVFKLGTKYTDALEAKYLDADKQLKTVIMGCYGIGIARIIAGLVEISHDDAGILWPVSLAPYEVCIVPMKVNDEPTMSAAEKLYEELTARGVDCLIDDRDARPGVKFNEIDLLGLPMRVVIGPKGLEKGQVETKWRWEKEPVMIDQPTAADTIADWVAEERNTNARHTAWRKSL